MFAISPCHPLIQPFKALLSKLHPSACFKVLSSGIQTKIPQDRIQSRGEMLFFIVVKLPTTNKKLDSFILIYNISSNFLMLEHKYQ